MERRFYFVFGDLLACVAIGAAAGWVTYVAMPGGWSPFVGMILGMALGMALGMLVGTVGSLFFGPLFGDLEISLPAGLAGIMAGMLVGMLQGMRGTDPATALWIGAAAGVVCLAYTYVLQARLNGVVK